MPTGFECANIAVYAEKGTEIGHALGNNKKSWEVVTINFVSIQPDPRIDGRQVSYVSFASGSNDGICIAAVSVAWPEGNSPKVWLGDIGANCSISIRPYIQYSKTQTGSDPQFQSMCVWINGDATKGITTQGFPLHIVDFGRTNGAFTREEEPRINPVADQWTESKDLLCKAPDRMSFYDEFRAGDLLWSTSHRSNPTRMELTKMWR